jgi:hypothetical protein
VRMATCGRPRHRSARRRPSERVGPFPVSFTRRWTRRAGAGLTGTAGLTDRDRVRSAPSGEGAPVSGRMGRGPDHGRGGSGCRRRARPPGAAPRLRPRGHPAGACVCAGHRRLGRPGPYALRGPPGRPAGGGRRHQATGPDPRRAEVDAHPGRGPGPGRRAGRAELPAEGGQVRWLPAREPGDRHDGRVRRRPLDVPEGRLPSLPAVRRVHGQPLQHLHDPVPARRRGVRPALPMRKRGPLLCHHLGKAKGLSWPSLSHCGSVRWSC